MDEIIRIAKERNVDVIHPGIYGRLSFVVSLNFFVAHAPISPVDGLFYRGSLTDGTLLSRISCWWIFSTADLLLVDHFASAIVTRFAATIMSHVTPFDGVDAGE